ncbi:hypothetical protein HDV05_006526 [Chytridiales sp. JEL 0842]|nr:hypothetical protein HDV05_006526 [Chytridiales sp. JEL 0842]
MHTLTWTPVIFLLLSALTSATPIPAAAASLPSCQFRSSATTPTSPTGTENNTTCLITPDSIGSNSFYIRNGTLFDNTNTPYLIRGANLAFNWFRSHDAQFSDLKSKGANTARVALESKSRLADVRKAVRLTLENKMVAVLENHDTTGYPEKEKSKTLKEVAGWWIAMKEAIVGLEDRVMVNIGNEPLGNVGFEVWGNVTSEAIRMLRDAGLKHVLVVDAPNWGQDWSNTMRDQALEVFNSDPLKSTIFSIHMYGQYGNFDRIQAYISSYTSKGLPIMIGEFGFYHSDGDVAEESIFEICDREKIGWLAWSWSGNGGGVDYLDLVERFNASKPTAWGRAVFDAFAGTLESPIFQTPNVLPVPKNANPQPLPVDTPVIHPPTPSKYNNTVMRLHIGPDTTDPTRPFGLGNLQCVNGLLMGGLWLNITMSFPNSSNPHIRYPPKRALGLPEVSAALSFPAVFQPAGPPDLRAETVWNMELTRDFSEWIRFKVLEDGQFAGFYGFLGGCEDLGEGEVDVKWGRLRVGFEGASDVEAPGWVEGWDGLPGVEGPLRGKVEVVNELPEFVRPAIVV